MLVGLIVGCNGRSANKVQLKVFAASSLTDVMVDFERVFEGLHPNVDVVVNSAGSQILRLQIEHGAAPDIFMSANKEHLSELISTGHLVSSVAFAYNKLALIVPATNPAGISSFSDLVLAKRIVLGGDEVPVGQYSMSCLEKAQGVLGQQFYSDVMSSVVSRESNVRLVRAKVQLSEADAGIVYQSDIHGDTTVLQIEIPPEANIVAGYSVGLLRSLRSEAPSEYSAKWVDFLLSADGQALLSDAGFSVTL